MTVIDMPVDIGTHERKVKEVIKGRPELPLGMEIAEVGFEVPLIADKGCRTLAEIGRSPRHDGSSCPSLKSAKGFLSIQRPLGVGKPLGPCLP